MSSAGRGYGEGFFYTPEDQAAQQAIRRRQAYAEALMQGRQHQGQYGGLADAGNSIAGALMAKRADQKELDLAKSSQERAVKTWTDILRGNSGQPGSGPSPQISNGAGTPQELDPEGNPMASAQPAQAQPPSSIMDRIAASKDPNILFRFGGDAIRQQMQNEAKHLTPMSPEETHARGLRGVWGKDASDNPVSIQQSDVKSPEAEAQFMREQKLTPEESFIKQAVAKGVPITTAHRQWAQAGHVEDSNAAGWQVVYDQKGNPYRYNSRSAQATDMLGKPLAGGPNGYVKIGTSNSFNLNEPEQAAINAAVRAGRLDETRLTRGNAKTIAATLMDNPNANLMNIHAYAQQLGNAQLQRAAQGAARIPGMLDTVAASGKALGYSDAQFIGKLQQWKNRQLNDPAFIRYMTQRNDALLSLAGAMRGNGVTDLATQLEEEAAAPTMSPAAIDAWKQAHMDVLQPMLDYYKNYAITNPQTGQPVNTPATTPKKPTASNW